MVAPLFLSPGEENVQDPMERGLFSRARAVFEALAPYRRQCLEDWKSEGIPFFCHPWIRYEGQKELLDVSDCLMVGSDLVISESPGMFGRTKTLSLPDDDWVHLWTSRRFGGGRVSIDAPPGVPALFYREKSKHRALFDQIRRMATRL
jgi:alpha-glucosidase